MSTAVNYISYPRWMTIALAVLTYICCMLSSPLHAQISEIWDLEKRIELIERQQTETLQNIRADNRATLDGASSAKDETLIWVGIIVASFTALVTLITAALGVVAPFFLKQSTKDQIKELIQAHATEMANKEEEWKNKLKEIVSTFNQETDQRMQAHEASLEATMSICSINLAR